MQTFLPLPDFAESARCLDWRRLGKQRVEAFQILNTLQFGGRWKNHPAVQMWAGFEKALQLYMTVCIDEWIRRGYKNTMKRILPKGVVQPFWFGDDAFHASHRSNLLRKNPEWYSQFQWAELNNLPYIWPTRRQT